MTDRVTPDVSLEAFAKVNRSLRVLGTRADGYHELDTLFQTIDLSDRLTFEPADELSFSCDDGRLPTDDSNLVVKSARLLAREAGRSAAARIRLEKRIPFGAGLGGGSADAAAALVGLSTLWGLSLRPEELAPLAARVGSDVPFFLVGGTARGTGRGERIEPLPDAPAAALLLLLPPFPLATPEVFRALGAPSLTPSEAASNLRAPVSGELWGGNDLEEAAESLEPRLRGLREALSKVGAMSARLSGSGSTVFGVFADLSAADAAASRLDLPAEVGRRVVPTLSRAEFQRRAFPSG